MVNLRESVFGKACRLWWGWFASAIGSFTQTVWALVGTVYAVSFYGPPDSGQSTAEQAVIQVTVIAAGLVSIWVIVWAYYFFWRAPRQMIADARAEIESRRAHTPVLAISEPAPSYGVEIDGLRSTLWRFSVSNSSPRAVATNVVVSVEIDGTRPPVFPLVLHERVRPREAFPIPPKVSERRDIRFGETPVYDLISEPHYPMPDMAELQWHSAEFNHAEETPLPPQDYAMVSAMHQLHGYVDLLVRAVADPPTNVAERRFRLRLLQDEELGADADEICWWWIEPAD